MGMGGMGNMGGPGSMAGMQSMMNNPEMMAQMMQSPIMQNMLNDPEMLRNMLQSTPGMSEVAITSVSPTLAVPLHFAQNIRACSLPAVPLS